MCLGVPAKVIRISGDEALVSIGGVEYMANIGLLESVGPGDYIILHAGFGIEKVDQDEALETIRLIREIEQGTQDVGHEPS